MNQNRFWFFALIACFMIGLASNWVLPAKVLAIGCSIVVLMQTGFRLYKLIAKEESTHVTK